MSRASPKFAEIQLIYPIINVKYSSGRWSNY